MTVDEPAPQPNTRPLPVQFAGLPAEIQSRLFRVLDVVVGSSHDEKWLMRCALDMAADSSSVAGEDRLRDLLASVSSLVLWADAMAEGRPAHELEKEKL